MLVGARLVDADGLLVQANPVEDFGGVVGALGGIELDETVALMHARHSIHGHVDVVDGAHLRHELPEVGLADALIEIADVHGRVLVLFPICAIVSALCPWIRFSNSWLLEKAHQCLAILKVVGVCRADSLQPQGTWNPTEELAGRQLDTKFLELRSGA